MVTVVLGCDNNNGEDQKYQDGVAKVLEQGGCTVEKLPRGPNYFASYSYGQGGKDPKGKKGVFLIAAGLTSIVDLYYGGTSFDYAVFGIRQHINGIDSQKDMETKPISPDRHGDCLPVEDCNKLAGKTYKEINEITKDKCVAVTGGTPEELGKNILSALNGGTGTSSNGEEEEEEEDWGDRDNFTPHKGKIMEIKPYKEISSVSFDKSYDSPTGTGTIKTLYSSRDYRFIYKGVAMKLKLRRTCDKEWSATGLEEPNYDENEKFFKEHIPTPELLKELGIPDYRKMQRKASGTSTTTDTETEDSEDSSTSTSDNSNSSSSSSSSRNT